jgi:hypothetical protein
MLYESCFPCRIVRTAHLASSNRSPKIMLPFRNNLPACREVAIIRHNEHYQDIRAKGPDFLFLPGRISAFNPAASSAAKTTFFRLSRQSSCSIELSCKERSVGTTASGPTLFKAASSRRKPRSADCICVKTLLSTSASRISDGFQTLARRRRLGIPFPRMPAGWRQKSEVCRGRPGGAISDQDCGAPSGRSVASQREPGAS